MMNRHLNLLASVIAAFVVVAGSGPARAATNGEKCAAAKMKAAAKYASCRLSADAKSTATGDPVDYTKCLTSQSASWGKIEAKYGVECLTSGDETSVETDITDATGCLAGLLSGDEGSCTFVQDPPCAMGGQVVDGVCWVLGAFNDSCNAACGLAGMTYSSLTETIAGYPGNLSSCLGVASHFGVTVGGSFGLGGPPDTGCATTGSALYLATSVTAFGSYSGFRRFCACQ